MQSQPQIEKEFRAAKVATADNIDLPQEKGLTPEEQKKELLALLDLAQSSRRNAVSSG